MKTSGLDDSQGSGQEVREGDQEVRQPESKASKEFRETSQGEGRTHQINGQCTEHEGLARRSPVTFKRTSWKVADWMLNMRKCMQGTEAVAVPLVWNGN